MTPRQQMQQLLSDAQYIMGKSDDAILSNADRKLFTQALDAIIVQTKDI